MTIPAGVPDPSSKPPAHRRTLEEALAQADAKERIRNARGVRAVGQMVFVIGVYLLSRWSRWHHYNSIGFGGTILRVGIHHWRSFDLSLGQVIGIPCLIAGPIMMLVGARLLERANQAALRNPVTMSIFEDPSQLE
jgi:hypothetical protein